MKFPLLVGWDVEIGYLAESSAEKRTSYNALGKKKLNEVFIAIKCFLPLKKRKKKKLSLAKLEADCCQPLSKFVMLS